MNRQSYEKFKSEYGKRPMFQKLLRDLDTAITARELDLQKQVAELQEQVNYLKSELTK